MVRVNQNCENGGIETNSVLAIFRYFVAKTAEIWQPRIYEIDQTINFKTYSPI